MASRALECPVREKGLIGPHNSQAEEKTIASGLEPKRRIRAIKYFVGQNGQPFISADSLCSQEASFMLWFTTKGKTLFKPIFNFKKWCFYLTRV